MYLEELIDKDTGLIDDELPTVLEYLFTDYGTVQSKEVKAKEAEALNLIFKYSDPMVILSRPIDQVMNLVTSASIPYSTAQQTERGITVIHNTQL